MNTEKLNNNPIVLGGSWQKFDCVQPSVAFLIAACEGALYYCADEATATPVYNPSVDHLISTYVYPKLLLFITFPLNLPWIR